MADVTSHPLISTPVIDDKAVSPLAGDLTKGTYGSLENGVGVVISERFGLTICEIAAWQKGQTKTVNALKKISSLAIAKDRDAVSDTHQIYRFAPTRWTLLSTDRELVPALTKAVGSNGSVIDLSHGRTVIRIQGPKVQWVLSKLFAIDFADDAFPVGKGLATAHHEIFAQIQRVDAQSFDIVVFRSYARAFWHALREASAEVGYEIA